LTLTAGANLRLQAGPPMFERLISMLERRDRVSDEERAQIERLPRRLRSFNSGEELVVEGSRPGNSCLVLSGLTARAQFLADGRRQFTALHVPGDFVDLHALMLKVMDHSVVAIGRVEAAFIPHASLIGLVESAPHVGRLFWLSTVIDAAIQRTWITNLGQRPPKQHIAHLICELYMRLEVVGLVRGTSFDFPATQRDLADMVGLSLVHVNRTIQELRAQRLLTWRDNVVTITDLDRLREFAEFDSIYLNLFKEPR
jgi:CRP-like cAMP-binding protein